jgi:3-isopropylmalate/(R)-2-methylmalate dehydratase small subunit
LISVFEGKVWKLGNDIDTDIIIPTQYLALKTIEEMKRFAFSPLRDDLAKTINEGDIIVAGKNFGCGSSREQAPEILSALKIKCIIAKSFARIFFRNSINNGILLIENDDLYDYCTEGDLVKVELNNKITCNGKEFVIGSLPDNLLDIIEKGGLVKSMVRLNTVGRG